MKRGPAYILPIRGLDTPRFDVDKRRIALRNISSLTVEEVYYILKYSVKLSVRHGVLPEQLYSLPELAGWIEEESGTKQEGQE